MDVTCINPFLEAAGPCVTDHGLYRDASRQAIPQGQDALSQGDVTGIVGLTGDKHGSLA